MCAPHAVCTSWTGSVLIDAGGWRWAFFVNLPVALVAWLAARKYVTETAAGGPLPDLTGIAMITAPLRRWRGP